LVTATGVGNGRVVVVASLINNPDIVATRTITLQNQGTKNPAKMIQAENYDVGAGTAATTWATGGNEMGLQIPITSATATLTYKNVDFAALDPKKVAARLAPNTNVVTNATIEVWIDSETTGTKIASIAATTGAALNRYATFTASLDTPVSGIHDVIIKSSAPIRLNWFTFSQYTTGNLFLLEAAVNTYEGYYANAAGYTPASWAVFDAAWTDGKAIVEAGSASDVRINAALTALNDAVVGLVPAVFTAGLAEMVATAQAILASPGDYIASSLTGLQAATDAAAVLLAPGATPTQDEVTAAATVLIAALSRAVEKGDPAALVALIAFCDTLNSDVYTGASWTALATAVAAGRTVAGLAEPSKIAVTDAFNAVNTALRGLVNRPIKTGLKSLIDVAELIAANIGAYAPSTVVGFVEALTAARAVYNDSNATAAQVSAAQSDLTARIIAAKLRAATGGLAAALGEASGVSLLPYSADSVLEVQGALQAGNALLGDPNATQEAVDAQVKAVQAAIAGLVPVAQAASSQTSVTAVKALQSSRPAIQGKAQVGTKLKAIKGTWTKGAKFTYRWYRNGKAIAKATKATYTLKTADTGQKITVKVTAKKTGYTTVTRAAKAIKIKK
jgi:hypothetical protein